MKSSDRPATYQIRVEGLLDREWADWFDGLTIAHEGNDTLLTGKVADQAALQGAINKLWDLGLTLVSLQRLD